jgi:hypothetical protein
VNSIHSAIILQIEKITTVNSFHNLEKGTDLPGSIRATQLRGTTAQRDRMAQPRASAATV